MKKMIVASTSTLHGEQPLAYLSNELELLFNGIENVLFIPYARPGGISYEHYTSGIDVAFLNIGKRVIGIHEFKNPIKAIEDAEAIYVGGGNTFLLVKTLYEHNVFRILKKKILEGTPYLGTSAGSNICGQSMQTSNDMPIVYPPSFDTLGVLPFNINPHYQDPNLKSTFMGETRETRILEYLTQNDIPVVGLREGSWLNIDGDNIHLKGPFSARIFSSQKKPFELETQDIVHFD